MANDNTDDLIISISTDQATLRRSIKRIESDLGTLAGTVKKQFDNVGRTVDNSVQSSLQNRINAMVGIGTQGAKEWTGALAEQGKELERLRARYSPLFNTINNYKSAVADIRQAHALGAISSNEMAAAISRERQAALSATAAIKGRNAALNDTPNARGNGSQGFNTSNLAAQGFDVAATAAFMPWYTVALQQGPQVAQVFNDIRASGQAIGPAVAGAFMQILNPVSLITIGTIGATAAAVAYFSGVLSDSNSASEKLKEQAQLIQSVADKWGDAVPALREYADMLKRAQDAADLKAGVTLINEKTLEGVKKQVDDSRVSIAALVQDLRAAGEEDEVIKRLQASFAQFATSADEGKLKTEEVTRVQDALAAAISSSGIPALSEFAKFFDGLSMSALSASDSVLKVADAAARMQDTTTWRSYNPQTGKLETNSQPWDENIQYGDNFTGTITPEVGPVPGRRPTYELDAPPKAKKTGSTRATASDRFTADIQALRDRSAAIQQEMQLIGLSNQQQVERRTALDLEQSALRDLREEARRKGQTDLDSIKLSPEKVATIQAEAAAYAKQAEALRIAQEQQQNLVEWNGTARNATRGFIDDLINGEGAAKAFANGLSKIGDALLDDVLDAIFKVNGAAGGSGGLIGQLFGSLFGGGGFKANTTFGSFLANGYSSGGYTGPGGANDVAGLVHKDEVVFSKQDVARNGGVAATEALRLKGSPTLVVPTAPALSRGNLSGNVTTPIAINIDATGADSAGLARVERQLARLQAELPATVVKTVQNAQGRRAL
ncbi:phage tail protein [Neorhizobium sp. BT27B]|uniref:phage tail length tape measure family protein n=1 Tax=Neorhizobium sp. BT27B TaxID=3142625 RepID=UPI003D2A7BC7